MTSIVKRMANVEDVTNKLTFDALAKRAIKMGNVVFFSAEVYFDNYIADYSYKLDIDSSILPQSIAVQPLSALMVDSNFTPRGVISSFVTSNGLQWRASQVNGNYLLISGWWRIN